MFTELKEYMFQELKYDKYQIASIKRWKLFKKNQIEILKLESTTTEIRNSLGVFNNRFELIEESICKLEDRSVQIIQSNH